MNTADVCPTVIVITTVKSIVTRTSRRKRDLNFEGIPSGRRDGNHAEGILELHDFIPWK